MVLTPKFKNLFNEFFEFIFFYLLHYSNALETSNPNLTLALQLYAQE